VPTERQTEDLLNLFTDRDDAIQAVVTRLDYNAYPPGSVLPLIVFHGIGGVGKTWLLRYLIEKDLKPRQVPYALVDLRGGRFNAADALFAELADQLATYGFQFPRFGLVFASYRLRTVGQDMAGPQLLLDHLGPVGKVVRAAPVIKDFAQLFDALEEAASDATTWFQTRLGETWRAQLQPRTPERLVALMPETFAADIAEELWGPNVKAGAVRRPVLILDTYEDLQRAGDDFVQELAAHLQDSLLIVAGWNRLPWPDTDPTWADPARLVQHLLGHFSPADGDYYLRERRHVADEGLRRRIYDFTQGHPMCLALAGDLVRLKKERGEPVDQATFPRREFNEKLTTQWLTKRLLERLPEQVEKDVRAASVPRRFNAEILGVLLDDPTGAERRLRALTAYSFVGVDEASGDFSLHGLVRQMLLAQLRGGRQERPYKELNRKLADYYAPQAQEDFAAFVEQMYHRWAFEPEAALSAFGDRFYHHVSRFALGECEWLLAAAREQAERHQAGLPDVLANEAQLRHAQARWDEALQILEPFWKAHEQLPDGLNAMVAGTLGLVYYSKGEWQRAIEFYQQSLAITEKLGDVPGLATTYMNLGTVYLQKGEWERAIEFYQKALAITEKLGDVHTLAQTYNNLGEVYRHKGEWDRAIEFYQKALAITEKLGDVHTLAQIYNNLGLVYAAKGEWQQAIDFYQQSLAITDKLGDVHTLAQTYNNLGEVYRSKGEWQRAIHFYQQSLAILEKLGDVHTLAQTYMNLGTVYLQKGEWERAIDFYQQSLAITDKLGDVHTLAVTYMNLGAVYMQKGEWERAIDFYQQSLAITEKLGDVHTLAVTCMNLGSVYLQKGEWDRAIEFYQKVLAITEKLGDVRTLAQTYNNLGSVYLQKGEWERATDFYQQSLAILEKLGDVHGLAQALMGLGLVYYSQGEWARAIHFYQQSLAILEKLGDVHTLAQTYNNLGTVYLQKGEWERAIEFYQKDLAITEKLGDVPGLAQTYNNLGLVYAAKGEWERAIEFYQQSLAITEKLGDVPGLAQTYMNLGTVYLQKGEWERAIEFYQKALAITEKLGDVHGLAQTYGNLGYLYEAWGDFKGALEYASKALDIFHRLGAFEEQQVAELVARLQERLAAGN